MPELEKLTVNVGAVDLGQIELLVEQGFYANRAEFVRVAIHDQLERHADVLRETTSRRLMVLGAELLDRQSLERARESGEHLALRVVGLLSISDDVSSDLAREVIETVMVRGIFKASPAVKDALADRMV